MATSEPAAPETAQELAPPRDGLARIWRAGRTAWAVLGLLAVAAVAAVVASRLPVVLVPLVLALFPATLLAPVVHWLCRHRVPPALAALATILAGLAVLAGLVGVLVPVVAAELPRLGASASRGLSEAGDLLAPVGLDLDNVGDLVSLVQEQLPEDGELAAQAASAVRLAAETIAGVLLGLVVLFFYLKDGGRIADALAGLAPAHLSARVRGILQRAWQTLGAYFRGQLLIALVDAVAIGLGLVLLGVPLALPLAVLIFFGGLFPIVGAVVSGALAVLVALADGGLVMGLIVLGLVLAVQQLEGNVLEPFVLGRIVRLHPLIILLSITAGAVLLGILGAFLAVPLAAIIDRSISYLRHDAPVAAVGAQTHAENDTPSDLDDGLAAPRGSPSPSR